MYLLQSKLNTAVERAKTLMTVEQHAPVNPIAAAQPKSTTELQQQITELTAQVAALTTCQSNLRTSPAFVESRPKRCYIRNKVGHLQYNCPTCQDPRFCFTCEQQSHGWRTCPQENGRGDCLGQRSSPPISPQPFVTVEQCHSEWGKLLLTLCWTQGELFP